MTDPYVYPHTDILKNLAGIRERKNLADMEAAYTSIRLAELVTAESPDCFDFNALCKMHSFIFQDVYEWAGNIRTINIEKEEPALGGISVEYSDCRSIKEDIIRILDAMNHCEWNVKPIKDAGTDFSKNIADLWKIHPFREGNTRTIVTFCCQFIESRGLYIDSDLFRNNAEYMRTALVAASAVFSDLGDKRKPEYLERIVFDALKNGQEMKEQIIEKIITAGFEISEEQIRRIVYWNRQEHCMHEAEEIKTYLTEKNL